MIKMRACMICKTILYFELQKCPECDRDTVEIYVKEGDETIRSFQPCSCTRCLSAKAGHYVKGIDDYYVD
jgi:hypothetical protein